MNIYDDVKYDHIGTSLMKITVHVTRFALCIQAFIIIHVDIIIYR